MEGKVHSVKKGGESSQERQYEHGAKVRQLLVLGEECISLGAISLSAGGNFAPGDFWNI